MPRRAKIQRKTNETAIELTLDIDGKGERRIATPVPFFNHMLEAVAKHGLFDLEVKATGDVDVDPHHLVEDVGICLGQAFREALGDMAGITRYGEAVIPMDETLVSAVVDFCGRAAFVYRADALKGRWVGHVRRRAGTRVLRRLRQHRAVQPAPRGPLRRERAPHDRGAVQGVRAGDRGGGAARPARRRRAVDQGDAHLVSASVVVADLGSGNLRTVEKALAAVGRARRDQRRRRRRRARGQAGRPGQGAFGACAAGLDRGGGALRQSVMSVIRAGRPFFGICIGMQLLFDGSEENPDAHGLAVLPGRVRRFPDRPGLKIPHMGWNQTRRGPAGAAGPAAGVADGACFYFVHSYFPDPAARRGRRAQQRARRRLLRRGRARQRLRLPVPPREEPGGGPRAAAQLRPA